MKLFDDIVPDDSPARSAERLYPFLNRSSWPVSERARALCEEWFSRYPPSDRKDLYRRFTSMNDSDHLGAYFELLLHELLLRLGASVSVHPKIARTTKRPDFLVELESGRFYLEAMVSHAREDNFGESPIFDAVCDWINEMNIRSHFVHIFFSDAPTVTPTRKSIAAQVQRLIRLSNSECDRAQLLDDAHYATAAGFLEIGDVFARIRLHPRPDSQLAVHDWRSVIRSTGGVGHSVVPQWREAIRRKAKAKELERYDAPCAVALNVMDGFATIAGQGVQAVYGSVPGAERHSGVWDDSASSLKRDTLAAVWMFRFAEPVQASPSGAEDCVLLKPSAVQQLPPGLVQLTHAKQDSGALEWFGGVDLDELLEVPHIPYEDLRRRVPSVH